MSNLVTTLSHAALILPCLGLILGFLGHGGELFVGSAIVFSGSLISTTILGRDELRRGED